MSYIAVKNIIQQTFEGLPYDVMFGSGREADFNQMKNRKFPLAWLDPMVRNAANPNTFDNSETWEISIVILVKADKNDTSGEQNDLVDFSHQIADDFRFALDEVDGVEFMTKPKINPLLRHTFGTDHTSGCILTFTLAAYDTYTC